MIQYSFFDPENGNCTETFFSGISLSAKDFATEVRTLLDSYENALKRICFHTFQFVGRNQFFVVVGLRSPFPC